jgi:hypothetical protein
MHDGRSRLPSLPAPVKGQDVDAACSTQAGRPRASSSQRCLITARSLRGLHQPPPDVSSSRRARADTARDATTVHRQRAGTAHDTHRCASSWRAIRHLPARLRSHPLRKATPTLPVDCRPSSIHLHRPDIQSIPSPPLFPGAHRLFRTSLHPTYSSTTDARPIPYKPAESLWRSHRRSSSNQCPWPPALPPCGRSVHPHTRTHLPAQMHQAQPP